VQFNPKNFCRITDESRPPFKIRTADHTTLILVKASGDAMYGRTRSDKDDIIADFNADADLLLWAWTGQFRTDIFLLKQDDIKHYYA